MTIDQHGFGQQCTQFVGDLLGLLDGVLIIALQAGEQHYELVAAQAGHGIFLAYAALQAGREHFQHRIADRMAERVVDVLEMIQIEIEQCATQIVASQQGDLLVETIQQQGAIGQVGQRVVVGQVVDLCLCLFQLADVAGDQQQTLHAVEDQRLDRDADGNGFAVAILRGQFKVVDVAVMAHLFQQEFPLAFGPDAQFISGITNDLLAAVTTQSAEAFVDFDKTSGGAFAQADCIR